MTQINPLLAQGLCCSCRTRPLAHGPWTVGQVIEAAADVGCAVFEFEDDCDRCYATFVAGGDLRFAEKLVNRKLVL